MKWGVIFFLLTVWLFGNNDVIHGQNTFVTGTIEQAILKEITLKIDYYDYDGTLESHIATLDPNNTFKFDIDLDFPVLATLEYARNKAEIYIEPNTTLDIKTVANSFQFSFKFSGENGANNYAYKRYKQDYPIEKNIFKYIQYRKGIHSYNIEPRLNDLMRQNSPTVFASTLNSKKSAKLKALEVYELKHPGLTSTFKDYIKADIEYWYAYHMLAYAHVYKYTHKVPDSFNHYFDTESIDLNSNHLGNKNYKRFLLAYLNWKQESDGSKDIPYVYQFDLSKDLLVDKAKSYAQAQLITMGLKKKYFDEMLPSYKEFIETNTYTSFDDYLVYILEKSYKISIGSSAPNFDLLGYDGSQHTIDEFKGKVVYLNFWASWCRPCIAKAEKMLTLEKKYENNDDIVFVHVSFDRTEKNWRSNVFLRSWDERQNVIHLFEPSSTKSDIAKEYQIQAIPAYFIINKEGRFAKKPMTQDIQELEKMLDEMLRESN